MKYAYDHMEEFEGVTFPDFRKYSGNLILYGAGINGALCAFALKEMGVDFLCFCDSDPTKADSDYMGYPVYAPRVCSQRFPNAVVLFDVYCSGKDLENLASLGYTTIVFPASLFLNLDCGRAAAYISEKLGHGDDGYSFRDEVDAYQVFEWIDEYMIRGVGYVTGRHEISRAVNLDLTDRCTLRCKNCLALKPYYTSREEMDWASMEKVLDSLLALKWLRRFHLLGGEPFLYGHLDKVLEKLCGTPEIEHINIITNGTVVPDEKILEKLKDPKVMVRISYYGELSNNYKKLVEACSHRGIRVRVHAQRWKDIGRALEKISSERETQERYAECSQRAGAFFYVLHGHVTVCPFAANTHSLGLYQSDGEDVVDITKVTSSEDLFQKLKSLYWRSQPLEACRYCNGWLAYATKPVPVAIQYERSEQPCLPQYKAEKD